MCGSSCILTALDKATTKHTSDKLTLLVYQFNNIIRIYIHSKYFTAVNAKLKTK